MDCKTGKGLLFLIIGLIFATIYNLLTSVTSFLTDDATASMAISFLGILSFIGGILVLIGLIIFLLGRKEFGQKHQDNVTKAIIIFFVNFIVVIIVVSAIVYMVVSAVSTSSTENIANPLSYVFIIITVISAILGGLMYYFALVELEDERGKNILYAAIVTSIAISIITSFYVAGILGDFFGSISTDPNSYSSIGFTQDVGRIGILGIISSFLYLYALYIPYNRIKNGELVPVVTPTGQSSIPRRICPNCNKNIPDDANICPYCGKQFEIYF